MIFDNESNDNVVVDGVNGPADETDALIELMVDTEEKSRKSPPLTVSQKVIAALENCSVDEILTAKSEVELMLKTRITHDIEEMRKTAEHIARATGVEVATVLENLQSPVTKRTRKSTEEKPPIERVKYRHPENPELKWTGRGRQPKWLEEALEEYDESDLLAA